MRRSFFFYFFAIVIFGLLLRFYNLTSIPWSLDRDEAFLGYNAFSLLRTGNEMTGDAFPLHLKSFLYTPAGYSYISILPILFFGLSAFSIRFMSALCGAAIPVIFALLFVELFKSFGKKNLNIYVISLFSAFLVAVSPWNIALSRTASVSTVVAFLLILGMYLFFKSRNYSPMLLVFSYLSFIASLFFYIAPYTVLPLLIPLCLYFLKEKRNRVINGIHLVGYCVVLGIVAYTFLSPTLSLRARSLSITNYPATQLKLDQLIREDGTNNYDTFVTRIFHNKAVAFPEEFLSNYFSHFSYEFLFNGKFYPDRYIFSGARLFYSIDWIFLSAGIIYILRNRLRAGYFLIFWILIIPLGSAMASDDVPNMQRILPMAFPLLGISAIGLYSILFLMGRYMRKGSYVLLILVYSYFIISYLHSYFSHSSLYMPWLRNDGYKELAGELKKFPNEKIVITNRESAPAIFLLFYNSYDPAIYQRISKKSASIHYDLLNFDRFEFSEEECPLKIENSDTGLLSKGEEKLYVNSSLCKIEKGTRLIKAIKRTDGSDVFYILKPDK